MASTKWILAGHPQKKVRFTPVSANGAYNAFLEMYCRPVNDLSESHAPFLYIL